MTEIAPEPAPKLSRDATYSTYAPVEPDPAEYPPPGLAAEQSLGLPPEVTPSGSRSKPSTRS